ncbi:MAG: PspA-associated protein PspAB, partial [Actinomycetales bacterium]
DLAAAVTDLHAVNTCLVEAGFGPQLLCSQVSFRDPNDRVLALVYLYKRGTFYPFAPTGVEQRDNILELQVRDLLLRELPVEQDLSRWFAVWSAPGL